MTNPRPPRLPLSIRAELEGLPWSLQRGSRHWRLMIGGTQVAVFSNDTATGDFRSTQNMRAYIRRYKRERITA